MKLTPEAVSTLRHEFRRSADLEAALRRKLETSIIKPVKEILLVGAIPKMDSKGDASGISEMDSLYVQTAFHEMKKFGISPDPDFNVTVVNIDPAYGGEDFLSSDCKADLVIVCHVFNPPTNHDFLYRDRAGNFATSPRHREKDAWYESVVRSDAKVLFVHGESNTEINASHFAKPGGKLVKMRTASLVSSLFINPDRLIEDNEPQPGPGPRTPAQG